MPSARDLYLILRAQDQANAVLNSFSRAVRKAGADTMLAQLDARKGAEAAALGQNRLEQATLRNSIAELSNENAIHRTQLAQALATGTTRSYVNAKQTAITNNERLMQTMRSQIVGHQDEAIAIRQNILNLDQEISSRKRAISAIEDHKVKMENLSNTMKSVSQTAGTIAIGFTAMGVAGVVAIGSLVKASAEYDRQARLTATQVDGMGEHLQEIKDIGLRVAHDIGVSFEQIQPALYDIFSSMNVGVAESEKLLTQFAKAAVAGQTDIQSVSRGTIAVMNSMQLSVEDITRILDVQFKFIQKGVGTYDEWATKIGLVAPSANRAGQSIEMMMATLASASKMAGVAARAGTAVARSFDAFSNPAAVAKLKALGVEAADANGNFRPFVDVMFDFRKALDQVEGGQVGKMKVILDVFKGAGGTIEARRFLQQILLVPGVLENLNGIYEETQNASGSLDKAYATMAESISAKTEKLKNRFKELKIQLGDLLGPAFGKLLDIGNSVLEWFTELDPKTQKIIVYFGLAATAASLLAAAIFGIVAVVAGVVAAFAVAGISIGAVGLIIGGLVLVVGGLVLGFAGLVLALKNAYDKSENFRSAVNRVKTDFWALGQMIKRSWKENVQPALDETAKIFKEKVKPAWEDFWATVRDKVEPKIHEFIDWCRQNVDPVMKEVGRIIKEDLNPQLEKMADWWKKNKDWLEPLIGMLAEMAKNAAELAVVIGILAGLGSLKAIAATFGSAADALNLLGLAAHYVKEKWQELMRVVADLQPVNLAVSGAQWLQDKYNELQQALEKLKRWWDGLPFVNAITAELQRVRAVVTFMFGDLLDQFDTFFGDSKGKSSGGWGGIGSIFSGGMGSVRSILSAGFIASGGIVGIGIAEMLNRAGGIHGLRNIFESAATSARNALSAGIDSAVGIASSIGGRVVNAVGSLGSVLYNAGQNIISGLIDGIQSMIPVLGTVLRAIGPYAALNKGPKAYDLTILRPAGNAIMQGLINGINDMTPYLKTQLQGISAQISPNFMGAMAPPVQPATKNITFNLTVNQADRSARQLAQDLGSELAGML